MKHTARIITYTISYIGFDRTPPIYHVRCPAGNREVIGDSLPCKHCSSKLMIDQGQKKVLCEG